MTKRELEEKYKGKIFAYSPSAEKPVIYQIEHFLDLIELQKILNHVDDLKLEFTLHGLEFLKQHYSFEKLAKILSESGGIAEYITQEEQILTWLLIKESYFRRKFGGD
jgi:hypothetical protein